jgi:hypothetical protein
MNTIKKIHRDLFEEQFEIVFGEEQTLNAGTSQVLFRRKQAFLKNKLTGEIISTDVFTDSEEYGELLVLEKFCL